MNEQAFGWRDRTPIAGSDAKVSSLAQPHRNHRTFGRRIDEARGVEDETRRRQASSSQPAPVDRIDVLGVGVSAVNLDDAVLRIERWIAEGSRNYVCVTSVHGLIESRRDERLRRVHNRAGMVAPDGMPLVWFARLCGRKAVQRVCGHDLMKTMTALSELRGYRQFYYGGAEQVANKLKRKLIGDHAKLEIVGSYCPPFRELTAAEDEAIVAAINDARPDIVWVGLSTPKQEMWMADHIGLIKAPVMIGVGAAFDFLAGTKRRAPAWVQRNGLEWLFRLCTEPRRLWRRYMHIVPAFLILAGLEIVRGAPWRSQAAAPESFLSPGKRPP